MAIGNIKYADILSYPVPIIGPTMVGLQRKNFQSKGSQKDGKRYFTNSVFFKRTILLIFQSEFTEIVVDILLYLEPIIRPTMVRLGKEIFKILRRLENANLRLVFANTVNKSFIYMFF